MRADGERLVAGAAATLAGVLAFSKFISPQYLVWLLPLVPLVVPPIGFAAAALLALAMVLGQLWFFHYRELFADGASSGSSRCVMRSWSCCLPCWPRPF